MRKIFLFVLMVSLLACKNVPRERPMDEVVNEALTSSVEKYLRMAEKYAGRDSILPRSFIDGKMTTSDSRWWCSGFFPGSLWYLYENSKDPRLLAYAKQYTARIEREKFTTNNHDVGFMLYCSFGNGLRLTGDTSYVSVLLTGAKSLSTRYNPKVGLIRSWDSHKDIWQYPVIIDNMMNLELMLWAANASDNAFYKDLSVSHADKTILNHYRPDFSCYHVVSYDTLTGMPHKKQTHQGYSDDSAWSRGQAWGLYGYAMMYSELKEERYLTQATNVANYLIDHPRMPKDFIPYWDFDAPEIPDAKRDASAGAIMASALIRLSQYVDRNLSEKYLRVAETQLRTLASAEYTAATGENGDFILKHSVGSLPGNSEVDVPLTYADYYFLEALMKYKQLVLEKGKS